MAPFYPDMAKDNKGLSSTLVGMVMSSFSVSFVIVSFFVGMKISKLGRRLVLYTGIIGQGISMIGFG
jgi:MFS family permease